MHILLCLIVCQSNNGVDTCKSEEEEVLSAGVAAGIAVTVTLLLALPLGVVIGLGVAWYGKRHGRDPLVRVINRRWSRCRKLSMRSHQRLPYISVTTRPMATLTYRGRMHEDTLVDRNILTLECTL